MPQLDPTFFASQLFWLAVTFVTLYIVLSRLILPPLQEIMERRARTVEGDVNAAQGFKSEAEKARLDYERALAEARGRAQALLADAMQAQKARAEQSGRDMDRQIEQKLTDASRRIAAKREELMAALSPATAELTGMIVEKLTQRAPSADQVSRVIDEIAKGRR